MADNTLIELYTQIILEKKPPIAKIILNRPEALNALNLELLKELDSALNEVCEDKDVRVLVISGSGRAFCAGADLRLMLQQETPTQLLDYIQFLDDVFLRLENLGKPVIASLNGYTLAGGLELMLCCDLAVASEQAILGDEHINRALMPGGGSTIRLPRIIGLRRAKELLYTGDRWNANQALQFGLVNKVVPHDKLEETVIELANKLATKSPEALKILKQVVNNSNHIDTRTAQILERIAFNAVFTTQEAQKGLQSFLSKK
jgi:enoyl-CoA hydratase/carnithine racemase